MAAMSDAPVLLDRPVRPQRPDRGGAAARLARAGLAVECGWAGGAWDEQIAQFADAAYEQTQAFRGGVWGEGRTLRVGLLDAGQPIAMALATTFTLAPLGRGLAYVKFGPAWRRTGESPRLERLELALDALVSEIVDRRRLALSVLPAPEPDLMGEVALRFLDAGFTARPLEDSHRYLVDVQLPREAQLASLGQKWRYNLKQAGKAALAIAVEEGPEAVREFDRLFAEMERRKSYKNEAWPGCRAALLEGRFAPSIRPAVILVRAGGQSVAGAVIGHIGERAHYLFGATSDRALALKAGYAMQWWIIGWLRDRGALWYDLGGEAGEQGLKQFKSGLAGRQGRVVALPGEFTLCRDPLSALAAKAILSAREMRRALRRSDWRSLMSPRSG
jgi:hypothetical protein